MKAKISCKAYTGPPPYSRIGRPRLKGEAVKLKDLFESAQDKFIIYVTGTVLYVTGFSESTIIDKSESTVIKREIEMVAVKNISIIKVESVEKIENSHDYSLSDDETEEKDLCVVEKCNDLGIPISKPKGLILPFLLDFYTSRVLLTMALTPFIKYT